MASSMAWLTACGGGSDDDTPTHASSAESIRAVSAQTDGEPLPRAQAVSPSGQWSEPNAVYADNGAWHRFTDDQVTVNDKGDVYVAWLSRHGGQTDVWVRQYSAQDSRWLQGSIVAVVPDTPAGRVLEVQVASAGDDVLVAWDVAPIIVHYSGHNASFAELTRPASLYVSHRSGGEGPWSAARPVAGARERPVGGYGSWRLSAMGNQHVGMFWFAADGAYLSSPYTVASQAWGPVQVLGAAPPQLNHVVDFHPVFNTRGDGIVGINGASSTLSPSSHFNRATGAWISTPLEVRRGTTVVDDNGNVQALRQPQNDSWTQLELVNWSAATGQASGPVWLYEGPVQFNDGVRWGSLSEIQLTRGTRGTVATWIERTDMASRQNLRRAMDVPPAGQVGRAYTLGQHEAVNWFATSGGGGVPLVSAWVECPSLPCRAGTSLRSPSGSWTPPVTLPQPVAPLPSWPDNDWQVLKVNRHGQGVLIQAKASGSFMNTQLRVHASILKQ